jgi:hypothetical protein
MAKVIAVDLEVNTKKAEEGVDNLTDSVGGLSSKLDSATGGAISGFKSMASGLKGVIGGFKTLKGAIIATGIGALVVVVTAAVEWFSNFDAAVKIVSTAMDSFNGALGQLGKSLDLLIKGEFSAAAEAFSQVGNAALDAAKSSQRLFDVTKQLQELQAENIPINAKLRQDLELQKKILEDTTLSEQERIAALNQVTELSEKIQKNIIAENKLKVEQLTLEAELENNDEQRRLKNIELANAQAELINQEGQLNIIRKDAAKVEREILAISRQQKNEQLAEELRLQEELLKAEKERDAAKIMQLIGLREELLKTEQAERSLSGARFDLGEVEKKQIATISQLKRIAQSQELAFAQNILSNLGGALEKNAKAQKAIQIAQTSISTFQGAVQAFTAAQIIPPPAGQIIGAANAAAVVAMGLANINKIKNTKIPTGGGTSSANGNATLPRNNSSAGIGFNPSTPTITSLPSFNTAQAQNNNSGSNVRAYVIQDDINSQTALNKRINQRTKL